MNELTLSILALLGAFCAVAFLGGVTATLLYNAGVTEPFQLGAAIAIFDGLVKGLFKLYKDCTSN